MLRHLAAICMLFAPLPAAIAQMAYEEAVVRTSYAKLSFAVDLNTVYSTVRANPKIDPSTLAKQVELQGLHFKLSDFSIGNLADIADQKYDVLGQYPDGQEVITTSPVSAALSEDTTPTVFTNMAAAAWSPGPAGRAPYKTVGEMLPIAEMESGVSPLLRYCAFTVTASLQGRRRTYRASFLFGEDDQVVPGDVVVALGGGAMEAVISHQVYPDILLRTSLWNNPAVRNFLVSTQRPEAPCKAGVGEVCCDSEKLQCGVASADLRRQP